MATSWDLSDIAAGVQPQENGRLLCRYCGRWFRSLGSHVRHGHGVSADRYREEFELPASRALLADDLREALVERGREAVATNPSVRAGFPIGGAHAEETARRRARGLVVKAQTQSRAGVQLSKKAVGVVLGASSTRRAAQLRQELDDDARARGYDDLRQLLTATAHLSHAALGEWLGWSADRARMWRRKLGVPREAVSQRRQGPPPPDGVGLAQVPRGEQPVDGSGRLRCLECGRWWVDLAQHVAGSHDLSAGRYRERHGLPVNAVLMAQSLRRRHSEQQRARLSAQTQAGVASPGQHRSAAVRRRYDAAAQRHGYGDVVALLRARANREVAVILGVRDVEPARLRRRYLPSDDVLP